MVITSPVAPTTRATWLVLAVIVILAGALTAYPGLRSPVAAGSSVAAVVFVLVGVLVHRPQSLAWPFLGLTLAFWATSSVLVYLQGYVSVPATAFVWAGQLVGSGVTVYAVRSSGNGPGIKPAGRSLTAGLDLVIIATVFAVVGVQIISAGTSGSANPTTVIVASVDVALLGMLMRFVVSRRGLGPSSVLVLLGAFVTIVYDLSSALHGRRLALPGEPSQILGVTCVLLLGAAALHPSMTKAFSPETFARRRRPSIALLGLMPLVLIPAGVWWVADRAGAPSLPLWAAPAAGAIIAGLCLLRASAALSTSEHLAEHDPLTDLANRRGLARAFDEAEPEAGVSLLLIDVDEFKQVNDTHGHDVGDILLLRLRDRLLIATGGAGLVARLGGDEFVVLTSTDQAGGVAERFLHSLQDPFIVQELVLTAGASIGIADADPGTTLAELLTHADVAMYAAKAAGGSRVLAFHPTMRVEVARRFTLSGQIRQLLVKDDPDVGHLEMHYQPLVDLRTGEAVGAEALVRWRHPKLGLMAPDAFLGLVTTNDLDPELDASVLDAVITQLAAWREEGRRALPVSVNLTRDSLNDPRLAERILTALVSAGVPTAQLHVEITEHHLLSPDSPAEHTLGVLKAAGVGIYLDDYGTGYTSLDYLHRFPIQVLKLDRSVVELLSEGKTQLVAAVNAMALALDLDVLAEGVETAEQRDLLVEIGIRYGQGYLFSRPLPASEYADSVLGARHLFSAAGTSSEGLGTTRAIT